jgi:dethiobiotin synthetase
MAPVNEENTMLDLMKALGYPVVLVSRTGLGAINHALLSLQALRAAGLTPVGVVFNQTEPTVAEDRFIHEDNPRTIARLGRVPVLGQVDYLDMQAPAADTWRHFDESVPGLPLVGQKLEHSQWKI